MSALPPPPPSDPPKIPTFPNQIALHKSIAKVFEDLQKSVEYNIGTSKQGVVCVPLLYFVAHLDENPPGHNQEITFLRRPETYFDLANVTSKVLMKDPLFLSAITHAYADIMAGFFLNVGEAVKQQVPDAVPSTESDVEENEPEGTSGTLPFKLKKKPDPIIH